MINVFKLKKWATLLFAGFIPTIFFMVGIQFYGKFWIGLACFAAGLLISLIFGVFLLKNPFTLLLEGKGVLCLDVSSSGIIKPFIANINQPYVRAKLQGEDIEDVFDRQTVSQLADPEKKGQFIFITKDKDGQPLKDKGIFFMLPESEYNKARFALFHYPVLIYNSQLKTFMTKDILSEIEKNVFSEHLVLYLNRKIEELTSHIRDFGRYIVELTKPKEGGFFRNKWVWIVILVGLGILAAIFAPYIISAIKGGISTVQSTAVGSAAVTPVG